MGNEHYGWREGTEELGASLVQARRRMRGRTEAQQALSKIKVLPTLTCEGGVCLSTLNLKLVPTKQHFAPILLFETPGSIQGVQCSPRVIGYNKLLDIQ